MLQLDFLISNGLHWYAATRRDMIRDMGESAEVHDHIKSHCNKCGGERNHVVLHREYVGWEDDIEDGRFSVSGGDTYYLLRCAGCDEVQMRHERWFSEWDHGEIEVQIYPPAVSRRKPSWMADADWHFGTSIPRTVRHLLIEIYIALQNGAVRSAALAIRALIEAVMIDKVGERGSLGNNIKAFVAEGYVPAKSHKLFSEKLIEGGNAAMHRGWKPTAEELSSMMDLTEWLVESLYIHQHRAAAVPGTIPQRQQKT